MNSSSNKSTPCKTEVTSRQYKQGRFYYILFYSSPVPVLNSSDCAVLHCHARNTISYRVGFQMKVTMQLGFQFRVQRLATNDTRRREKYIGRGVRRSGGVLLEMLKEERFGGDRRLAFGARCAVDNLENRENVEVRKKMCWRVLHTDGCFLRDIISFLFQTILL